MAKKGFECMISAITPKDFFTLFSNLEGIFVKVSHTHPESLFRFT